MDRTEAITKINITMNQHIEMFYGMLRDEKLVENIWKVVEEITFSLKNGGKLLVCGNGGSASDAQHIVAEFVGRFEKERQAFNAEALVVNPSILTAIGNDYGFEEIFSRQVEAKGKEGDILIGISTSGISKNVIRAIKRAKELKMTSIMFMGQSVNPDLEAICDYQLRIPEKITARVQEGHIFIGHVIAGLVEEALIGNCETH